LGVPTDETLMPVWVEIASANVSAMRSSFITCWRTDQANGMTFDLRCRAALFALLGKDMTEIDGIGPYLSFKLIGECGDVLFDWPSAKHLTSWLGLAPNSKILSTVPCATEWST
jgi:Transposase IS116/IS110/IS902 family